MKPNKKEADAHTTVSGKTDVTLFRCLEVAMKAVVNKDGCISCGLCVSTCPEVFAFDEDGKAEANGKMDDSNFASAESARSACPVAVIDIIED